MLGGVVGASGGVLSCCACLLRVALVASCFSYFHLLTCKKVKFIAACTEKPLGPCFLLMEDMDGGDLHKLINQNPEGLSDEMVADLAIDILEGLEYLHNRKLMHRNFDPENIFLKKEGNRWVAKIAGNYNLLLQMVIFNFLTFL